MMRVAGVILMDSLRLIRARKMFGISMGISILIGVLFAALGIDENGVSLFGFRLKEFPNPLMTKGSENVAVFYVLIFTDIIVRYWLSWVILIIGLLSTISIFPDLVAEGSIGVSLSKPVSRFTLFFWKYVGALLFVALQVFALTLIIFLALGFRIGEWNFTVFWAVPVVTFVFSLIYCTSVLAAVWTKSTAFSLIAGTGIWGLTLLAQWGEDVSYQLGITYPEMGIGMDLTTGEMRVAEENEGAGARRWNNFFNTVLKPLPKTRACTLNMKQLIKFRDRDSILSGVNFAMMLNPNEYDPEVREAMEKYEQRHSALYVYGSSAAFELVILGLALGIFCRRDF